MDRQPLLIGVGGQLDGQRFPITPDGLMVGRDPSCDVSIDDPDISREHARVFLHNSAVWVQDAGSRNGVFVGGKRLVRPKQVAPGDSLTVGTHGFTVELVGGDTDEAGGPVELAPAARATEPAGTGESVDSETGNLGREAAIGLLVVALVAGVMFSMYMGWV